MNDAATPAISHFATGGKRGPTAAFGGRMSHTATVTARTRSSSFRRIQPLQGEKSRSGSSARTAGSATEGYRQSAAE
jgi:hypothetical protein